LVVKTTLETAFDSRWCEIKIDSKNIPSRSNHVAVFFDSKMYVHGGNDADSGVMSDFNCIDVAEDCPRCEWRKLSNTVNGELLRFKGHTGVVYKGALIVFGG
jgi:hypothetical protein